MKTNIKYIAHLLVKLGNIVDMSQYLRGLDSLVELANQAELDLSNYTQVGYDNRNEYIILYDGDSSEIRVDQTSAWFPGNYGTSREGDIICIDM